jgi:hypothetical protein
MACLMTVLVDEVIYHRFLWWSGNYELERAQCVGVAMSLWIHTLEVLGLNLDRLRLFGFCGIP